LVRAGAALVEVGDPLNLEVVADLLSTGVTQIEKGAAVRIEGDISYRTHGLHFSLFLAGGVDAVDPVQDDGSIDDPVLTGYQERGKGGDRCENKRERRRLRDDMR
jgi:hypothetical protein